MSKAGRHLSPRGHFPNTGDGVENANYDRVTADRTILNLTTELEWLSATLKQTKAVAAAPHVSRGAHLPARRCSNHGCSLTGLTSGGGPASAVVS